MPSGLKVSLKGIALLLAGTILRLVVADAALAQSEPAAGLNREYIAAYDEVQRRPTDLQALYRLANLAVQVGEYVDAISMLERMLLLAPELPRVRLELAVLYYHKGAYEAARFYVEAVLEGAVPPEVRIRAEKLLEEIDRRTDGLPLPRDRQAPNGHRANFEGALRSWL